ncbi:uncharacterized protein PV06_04898 [Exophiala oligosperma]|uniref:DUF7779 domain-containing protein n=1 Tax=Exophiala oligosperma TaxID=215243 RepID=A0A0D2AVK0_9EURO|nr:uncharacterized protein PV06_04898 [Exophiala oligosperma]KIW43836.1 hypothetical protein PV06_04898 [Exophiala oligosperma]
MVEGTSSVLEIPFTATNAFHGRESYFKHIEDYFFGEPHNQDAPRTFAICGSGGSGKTQTAIQYALRYRERYKSAVIFINAASHATLISDFEKVSDLMKLTKGTNKVAGVQAWLSDKKNKDWLLIFDNADDLASICLSNYFPRSKWGHILITSRDQSAVGLVSVEGSSMEPLTAPEAVKVLLQKAHITSHSDKIQSDAETLVNDLGYLPLAIDQAASYVLTRKKTLSDYRRLYHTRQLDLLSYHSKLSNYDKTVLTTWELNFTQVEQDFPAAAILLMIFCFLDAAAITDNMLLRGCTKMNRWSKLGEIEQVSAIDVGIDRFLVDMITDEVAYDDAIEKLLSFSLIRRNNDYNEVRSVSVHPLVQSTATLRVSSADQNKWRTQAILLVCHAFPRDQFIEDTFGDTGRPMMPHVARMLKEFDILCSQMPAPKILRQQVTECLLAASRFLHNSWKEDCTRRVKDLIKDLDDPFVKAWAAQREAAIIRLRGNRSVSQDTLELYLKQLHSRNQQVTEEPLREIKDARLNAMQGQIIVSYAENLLQDNHLAISEQELLSWRPLDHDKPSSLENVALAAVQTNLGRIMREKGDFETSLSYFELLHKETLQDDNYEHTGSRRIVLSNMADLYCELRREGEAINLVQTELDYMEARGHQHISSGRRLQLCLAEAYICLGRRTEARRWLTKVKDALDAMQEPDVLSKYTLFRVWYGLARLAHSSGAFGEARDCWQKAFDAGCLLGWEGKYPLNLVKYSLAHVLHELGDHAEAEELLETAEESIKASGRKFWIVGMATYWFDYVQMQLSQSRATTTTTWTRFGKMAVGSFGSSGVASVAE